MKMKQKVIFHLYAGHEEFNNFGHVYNFFNYLFSLSKNHQKNEHTKLNYYLLYSNGVEVLKGFNIEPEKELKKCKTVLEEQLKKYTKLLNDLVYLKFLINDKDGNLITNLLEVENDKIYLNLSEVEKTYIIKTYFDNDESEFLGLLNRLVNNSNNIISLNKIEDNSLREEIELLFHRTFNKDMEDKILLSVSHNDQEEYHIHRLILK